MSDEKQNEVPQDEFSSLFGSLLNAAMGGFMGGAKARSREPGEVDAANEFFENLVMAMPAILTLFGKYRQWRKKANRRWRQEDKLNARVQHYAKSYAFGEEMVPPDNEGGWKICMPIMTITQGDDVRLGVIWHRDGKDIPSAKVTPLSTAPQSAAREHWTRSLGNRRSVRSDGFRVEPKNSSGPKLSDLAFEGENVFHVFDPANAFLATWSTVEAAEEYVDDFFPLDASSAAAPQSAAPLGWLRASNKRSSRWDGFEVQQNLDVAAFVACAPHGALLTRNGEVLTWETLEEAEAAVDDIFPQQAQAQVPTEDEGGLDS